MCIEQCAYGVCNVQCPGCSGPCAVGSVNILYEVGSVNFPVCSEECSVINVKYLVFQVQSL